MKIPLVDLKAQYARIKPDIDAAIQRVLDQTSFILGEEVSLFEQEFAAFCSAQYAVGCNSGTDAIYLACKALGIGAGDEVIVPAFTFAASGFGVSYTGAKPVLVDVSRETGLLDVSRIEAAITPRTRAIMPVHLYGQTADLAPMLDIARKHGLYLIEDAAQAHGARYGGQPAGSIGDVGCFSFYPGKNLGAYGDAGLVTTSNEEIADKLQVLRNIGSRKKYYHEVEGPNSRLDTLQAAVLRVKLKCLPEWNAARKLLAAKYDAALAAIPGLELTQVQTDSVYHLYVVRVAGRDEGLKALQAAGIFGGIHYPFALHELEAYRKLGYQPGDFPVSEDWARRCLTLPIYAEMPAEAVPGAADALRGWLTER
jgi:dTDP-4-amino-4,6-dideoxygalactose transaminase